MVRAELAGFFKSVDRWKVLPMRVNDRLLPVVKLPPDWCWAVGGQSSTTVQGSCHSDPRPCAEWCGGGRVEERGVGFSV